MGIAQQIAQSEHKCELASNHFFSFIKIGGISEAKRELVELKSEGRHSELISSAILSGCLMLIAPDYSNPLGISGMPDTMY